MDLRYDPTQRRPNILFTRSKSELATLTPGQCVRDGSPRTQTVPQHFRTASSRLPLRQQAADLSPASTQVISRIPI